MFLLVLLGVLGVLILIYDKTKLRYWERRGVKSVHAVPFFGHWFPVVLATKFAGVLYTEMYRVFNKERYFGAYEFHRPVLVLRDTKLIQDVLVKDFSHFSDHPNWIFDDRTFLRYSVLRLNGNFWRAVRYKFTPSFTGNRMDSAFKRLLETAPIKIEEGVHETREIINKYVADAIASYFATTIENKDGFQKTMRQMFHMPVSRYMEVIIVEHFPRLAKMLGAKFVRSNVSEELEEIMRELTRGPSEFRKMMLEIMNEGSIEMKAKDFDATGEGGSVFKYVPTEELMLGQVAQFVAGGLDTTGNTMSFIAYDLAKHPETQKAARSQIQTVLAKHGGQWTYDAVKDLTYLQNVIYESTRLHPVLPFLFRDVTKDYTLDDGLVLKRGDKIVIPSIALQTDPDYYPEPDKFKPERWEDIEEARNNFTWLPFGDGPRQCLGMRFAFMEMKFAFAKILLDYDLSLSETQEDPPKLHPRTFLTQIDGPLLINYTKL